jgi:hypothetical protein
LLTLAVCAKLAGHSRLTTITEQDEYGKISHNQSMIPNHQCLTPGKDFGLFLTPGKDMG